jgi:hypothetical protein
MFLAFVKSRPKPIFAGRLLLLSSCDKLLPDDLENWDSLLDIY